MSPFDDGALVFGGELREDAQQVGPFEVREPGHPAFVEGARHLLHEAWSSSTEPIHPEYDATAHDAGLIAAEAGVAILTLIRLNPRLGS